MKIVNSNQGSREKTSALIEKLRRQMTTGNDAVPASVYEAHDAHWAANYASRHYVEAGEDYEAK